MSIEHRDRNQKIYGLWCQFGDSMTLAEIGRLASPRGAPPMTKQRVWQIVTRMRRRAAQRQARAAVAATG